MTNAKRLRQATRKLIRLWVENSPPFTLGTGLSTKRTIDGMAELVAKELLLLTVIEDDDGTWSILLEMNTPGAPTPVGRVVFPAETRP